MNSKPSIAAIDEADLHLLTVRDVARRLQVSERAVRRWIAEDRLPAVHLGRVVRLRSADVARLIATGLSD